MMSSYKPRIPVAPQYAQAYGQAAYNFTYLEWCVIWSVEKLKTGYLHNYREKTAGEVANDFVKAAAKATLATEIKQQVETVAGEFKGLTSLRNDLLHAHPYTAKSGEQRLLRRSPAGKDVDWTIEEIDAAALAFETCAIEVNRIFHNFLNK